MQKLQAVWRGMFDVRPGEHGRVIWMTLYLTLVLFAYYILKPLSRAMFVDKFDIDKLPWLYILMAAVGGAFSFFFSKAAVSSSLKNAVTYSNFLVMAALMVIWWLLGFKAGWNLYAFNIFVSLFGILLVTQAWYVAANVFSTREAKRLYGILGAGAIAGAAFGGSFTSIAVYYLGNRNLVIASAFVILLSYFAFLATIRQPGVTLAGAKGGGEEEFAFSDVLKSIRQYRHLQVIIGIISLTYIVDVIIEFQFNAMAKETYQGVELTAFFGSFLGIWLNLLTLVLQFFLTAFVVSHFGIGGTLQILPVTVALASLATFLVPGIVSTSAAKLSEAATRYSFNRTGMELLYMPLPSDLKNRSKAFVDVFADRFARAMGGVILLGLTAVNVEVRYLSLVAIGFAVVCMFLSIRAKDEYVNTVRKRLESRRLDLDSLRINVSDPNTIVLLEQATESSLPRQATYGLSLLADAPGYPLEKQLMRHAGNSSGEVRAKVYQLARARRLPGLQEKALEEVRSARSGDDAPVVRPAVEYALEMAEDPVELAQRLLDHPNALVSESAVNALVENTQAGEQVLTKEWIAAAAASDSAQRRILAATAVRLRPEEDAGILHRLLMDSDTKVAAAACATAGTLQSRTYLDALLKRLSQARLRQPAMDALAGYGERIVGTLGDVLFDPTMPVAVRRQIPRVLRRIDHQRSVDVLLQALSAQDLTVRAAVLKALNKLRESNPGLNYGRDSVMQHISKEARYYYELNAVLAPFREHAEDGPVRLLARTIEQRLDATLERLFRLIGLRYPSKEIYAAYQAVHRKKSDESTAAIDFLDNVLERELKKVLLPLLDDNLRITQSGREIFGIEAKEMRSALRELLKSGDSWLVACAIATAAQLNLKELVPEITPLSRRAGTEVGQVAQAALVSMS